MHPERRLAGNVGRGQHPRGPVEQLRPALLLRNCGTPLYVTVDHQPDTLDFSAVTLDDPEAVPPEYHIFWSSRIGWFNPDDDLPRHERFRPDTKGLAGIEPPDDSSMTGGAKA